MAYRDILVFLDDSHTNFDRTHLAFEMAGSLGSRVTGAVLASLKPMHAKNLDDKAIERLGIKMSEQLIDDFNAAAAKKGLSVNTISISGDSKASGLKLAHYARNFDLVILAQPDPKLDSFKRLQDKARQVILHSGRPVLFVPYIGSNRIPCEKALIAWDGTPAVSRAVHDAIPLLSHMKTVEILVVESRKQLQSKKDVLVDGLAYHLMNHGIDTEIRRISPGESGVHTVIQNQITENGIDLLIMGGQGTPSLRQKILGGVSQKLLTSMVVPVLMSH